MFRVACDFHVTKYWWFIQFLQRAEGRLKNNNILLPAQLDSSPQGREIPESFYPSLELKFWGFLVVDAWWAATIKSQEVWDCRASRFNLRNNLKTRLTVKLNHVGFPTEHLGEDINLEFVCNNLWALKAFRRSFQKLLIGFEKYFILQFST